MRAIHTKPPPSRRAALRKRADDDPEQRSRDLLRERGLAELWRLRPRVVVRAALIGTGLALLLLVIALASREDPETKARKQQVAFVAQATQLCDAAVTRKRQITLDARGAPASPEAASEVAAIRLKLSADLGTLTPRGAQIGNVRRLRDQLARRSAVEARLAGLAADPASPDRTVVENQRVSETIVLQALAGALQIPSCASI